MGATLWAGSGAVLSHESAAYLYGLIRHQPKLFHVTVGQKRNSSEGIKVHVDPELPARPRTFYDGIPIQRVERVVFDMCGALSVTAAGNLIDDAVRASRVDPISLGKALDRYGANGKKGTSVLRKALVARYAEGITDSAAEDLFKEMARRRRLQLIHHFVVRDGKFVAELDFSRPDLQIDIEIDGGDHANPRMMQLDHNRDIELGLRGWKILRYTYRDLVERPDWVFESIRRAIEERSALPGFPAQSR